MIRLGALAWVPHIHFPVSEPPVSHPSRNRAFRLSVHIPAGRVPPSDDMDFRAHGGEVPAHVALATRFPTLGPQGLPSWKPSQSPPSLARRYCIIIRCHLRSGGLIHPSRRHPHHPTVGYHATYTASARAPGDFCEPGGAEHPPGRGDREEGRAPLPARKSGGPSHWGGANDERLTPPE